MTRFATALHGVTSCTSVAVLAALWSGCAADFDPVPISRPQRAVSVIGGASDPSELGFAIGRLERGAVLGHLLTLGGETRLGCSGTLIGDRVVVTAGHCVVMNADDWLAGREEPIVESAHRLSYAVGDNAEEPHCVLQVASVHLHPEAGSVLTEIAHDVAIMVLETSVIDTCRHAVPLVMNRDPLPPPWAGEMVLQGGFGSTDGGPNMSTVRYWSLLELLYIGDYSLMFGSSGQGEPAKGDSGSGALYRFPDGSLRNLGVCSTHRASSHRFRRLDAETPFIDEVVDAALWCGRVDAQGICHNDAVVRCNEQGFAVTDCLVDNLQCAIGDDGTPACACTCDVDATCRGACACDPQCPCDCDTTSRCNGSCDCDPDCPEIRHRTQAPEQVNEQEDSSSCTAAPRSPAGWGRSLAALLVTVLAAASCRRLGSASG